MKTFLEIFFNSSEEEMEAGIPLFTLSDKKREAFLKCLKFRLDQNAWPTAEQFREKIVFQICLSDEEKQIFEVILISNYLE